MGELVRYEHANGVARIVIDDGKVNAMSTPMMQALSDAFDSAAAAEAVVVLSSGRPGIFSAGFDLKVLSAGDPLASVEMVRTGAELALKVFSFPYPVLGVCEGHAYPMGAFLLLASDLRIGTEGSYRMGLNEVAIGIAVPSFALELAAARLHPAWLSRTATTGELYGPEDAVRAGFLDRVVPADELEGAVQRAIEGLKAVHLGPHRLVKQRLRGAQWARIRSAIDAELTLEAYRAGAAPGATVRLPGAPVAAFG